MSWANYITAPLLKIVSVAHFSHISLNFGRTEVFVFKESVSHVRFGRGTGGIFFGYMTCEGTETALQEPSCSRYSNLEYCSHDSDVGVRCDSIDSSGECCGIVIGSTNSRISENATTIILM